MNKEEQIKRLAQNLYNKGFTKSMDFAIQTAAKMLGFPESMLQNRLAEAEARKYGGESLLNGGAYYGHDNQAQPEAAPVQPREQQEYRTQHEEMAEVTTFDMRKRIAQSIAEDSVYSKVPSALRTAVEQPSPQNGYASVPQQQASSVPSQNAFSSSQSQPERYAEFEEVEKPSLSLDFSPQQMSNQSYEEPAGQEISSQENIFDGGFSDNESSLFVENKEEETYTSAQANEFNEDEQTSLVSGFMQQAQPQQAQPLQQEPMESYSDSTRYPAMQEPAESSIEESGEDFFTVALQQQSRVEVQEQPRQEHMIVQQSVPQQAPAQRENSMAEATVDLSQMFNFNNLKNR